MAKYDPYSIRQQFPILNQQVNGKPLVYLDNAATSQSPTAVIESATDYYNRYNSNIHRGTHALARLATDNYEQARSTIATFLGSELTEEIIFTSGTTDSINLVAQSLTLSGKITKSNNIVISELEHHSNIVPWQMLCQATEAELKVIPVLDNGTLDIDTAKALIDERTALVAISHVSNALGTINPIEEIIALAKHHSSLTLIDAAQSIPHHPINVTSLGCDFLTFSGHKAYGPTGTGILWGKKSVLDSMPPWRGGGEMIKEVTFEHTTYNDLPFKFEAGTPNIEGAISLAAALSWIKKIGISEIAAHEQDLLLYTTPLLKQIDGLRILADHPNKAGVISFVIEGIHHYDLGTLIDQMGVATRTGHHCCQPLMARFGITGTTRASFAAYNTKEDCDALIEAITKAVRMLQ